MSKLTKEEMDYLAGKDTEEEVENPLTQEPYRKQLKIEARQALETWEIKCTEHEDRRNISQEELDMSMDLAMHSTGEIKTVLIKMVEYIEANPKDDEMIYLRVELETAYRETINFRQQNLEFSKHNISGGAEYDSDEESLIQDLAEFVDVENIEYIADSGYDDTMEDSDEDYVEDNSDGDYEYDDDGYEE